MLALLLFLQSVVTGVAYMQLAHFKNFFPFIFISSIGEATRRRLQDKKLSYRRVTARCVLSVVILPITSQQCRNYLYDKS